MLRGRRKKPARGDGCSYLIASRISDSGEEHESPPLAAFCTSILFLSACGTSSPPEAPRLQKTIEVEKDEPNHKPLQREPNDVPHVDACDGSSNRILTKQRPLVDYCRLRTATPPRSNNPSRNRPRPNRTRIIVLSTPE